MSTRASHNTNMDGVLRSLDTVTTQAPATPDEKQVVTPESDSDSLTPVEHLLLGTVEAADVDDASLLLFLQNLQLNKEFDITTTDMSDRTPHDDLVAWSERYAYPSAATLQARVDRVIAEHNGDTDIVLSALQTSSERVSTQVMALDETLERLLRDSEGQETRSSVEECVKELEQVRSEVRAMLKESIDDSNKKLKEYGLPIPNATLVGLAKNLSKRESGTVDKIVRAVKANPKRTAAAVAMVTVVVSVAALYKARRKLRRLFRGKGMYIESNVSTKDDICSPDSMRNIVLELAHESGLMPDQAISNAVNVEQMKQVNILPSTVYDMFVGEGEMTSSSYVPTNKSKSFCRIYYGQVNFKKVYDATIGILTPGRELLIDKSNSDIVHIEFNDLKLKLKGRKSSANSADDAETVKRFMIPRWNPLKMNMRTFLHMYRELVTK